MKDFVGQSKKDLFCFAGWKGFDEAGKNVFSEVRCGGSLS
jgi:hypothetical protein